MYGTLKEMVLRAGGGKSFLKIEKIGMFFSSLTGCKASACVLTFPLSNDVVPCVSDKATGAISSSLTPLASMGIGACTGLFRITQTQDTESCELSASFSRTIPSSADVVCVFCAFLTPRHIPTGIMSSMLVFPADVVRRRLQVQALDTHDV